MARNNELVPIKCRQADNFGTDYECTELVDAKTRAEAAEKALAESARKYAERVAALEKVAKAARILSNLMPPDSCDGIDEVQAYEILVAHLTALDKLEEK